MEKNCRFARNHAYLCSCLMKESRQIDGRSAGTYDRYLTAGKLLHVAVL